MIGDAGFTVEIDDRDRLGFVVVETFLDQGLKRRWVDPIMNRLCGEARARIGGGL
ncbi:MAG: hypothetical protein RIB45_10095 [Marivibrio sp.]|uniref:hypothetical protein n=1 Tax=Marivibrio sp. TaxID=2039719 RepID=UPI0032ECA97D